MCGLGIEICTLGPISFLHFFYFNPWQKDKKLKKIISLFA